MESHLLQMRGLKQETGLEGKVASLSHLLQMRGLKPAYRLHSHHRTSRIFYRCVD